MVKSGLRQLLLVAVAACVPVFAASADEGDYSRKGADTCLSCHEDDVTLAVFGGKHAIPTDPNGPFGHGQLQCEACHGPSGDHSGRVRRGKERPAPGAKFGSDSGTPIETQNGLCMNCHEADVGFGWHGNAHDENLACADCHTSHAASDPVLMTSTQPDVCFGCHQQQRTQSLKPYAHPIRQGKMDCSGCHSTHGATSEWQFARQTLNDTCYSCHAEKRGPFLWEHAPVSEDCGNCHDPHGSNHPGMLTLRGPMLCQSCHSQDGHPSVAVSSDGLPGAMPSQFLLGQNCMNCHSAVHGSNHPSGSRRMR